MILQPMTSCIALTTTRPAQIKLTEFQVSLKNKNLRKMIKKCSQKKPPKKPTKKQPLKTSNEAEMVG